MKPKINYKSIMTEHGLMAYEQSQLRKKTEEEIKIM